MMYSKSQPLYFKDHKSGDVYQVLNVLKDRSEGDDAYLSSHINSDDSEEEFEEEVE